MIHRILGIFTDARLFQTDGIFNFAQDRFLTIILCLLVLIFVFGYSRIIVSKRGKTLFWIGSTLLVIALGLTVGLYLRRLPHGLSGSYYANPSWSGKAVNSRRYFETSGRRVDRFIDFHPNDFNNRYSFSGKPFSANWQGYVYMPDDGYQLGVVSNFGAWVYVDDTLIEGPHTIDFGTPEARTYLREGWSHDEQWEGESDLTFIWSSGRRSEFYLGVDEVADYQLVFRCIPFSYKDRPEQKLTIHVNGIALGSPIMLKESWNTYTIPVPHSALRDRVPGFFRVRFMYSNVVRPSEITEQSEDKRQLAVAFDFVVMQKHSEEENRSFDRSQELRQSSRLSQGIHHIALKAQSQGEDPFIKLTWKQKESEEKVIPEDYLFPETSSPDSVQQLLPGERIMLGVSIGYKVVVFIFLGSLIIAYIVLPHIKKLLTWDSLLMVGLVALAFGMLLYFLFEARRINPTFYVLPHGTDQLNYIFYARGFFRGYWPWYGDFPLRFNPLVPLFLIFTHSLVGENLLLNRLVVAIMSAVAVALLYPITRKSFNTPVAVIASLLCAINGVYIFYGVSLLVAPQVTFLNVVLLWYVHRISKKFLMRHALIIGILFGLLALGRATFLLFMPFLFLWVFWKHGQNFFRKLVYCLVISCVVFVVISPITFLNYYYSTPPRQIAFITDAGGLNLWIGNHSGAQGDRIYDEKLLQETREHMKATGNTYVDEVWLFIKEQPVDYLKLLWRKFTMFWRGYEIPNLKPYYLFRENSSLLRLPLINFVILGPLGIVGLLLTRKKWKQIYLLHAFVFVQVALNVLFLTLARYRIPVVPILSIFAAYTIFSVYQAFRQRKFIRAILLILLCIVLHVIINYPYAARMYERHYHSKMPLVQVLRYWDIFRFYGH